VRVRTGTKDDLSGFSRIALTPTGQTSLSFAPQLPSAVLKRCLLAGTVLVVEGDDGQILGYAAAQHNADHAVLTWAVADVGVGASAVVAMLIAASREAMPAVPCTTQIMLGDIERERVLEAGGFVPGEVEPLEHNGLDIFTRRWWAEALRQET
jgi:hypothetical protein